MSALLCALLPTAFFACHREDPRIRELTARAAQTDEAEEELRRAWSEQFRRFGRANLRNPPATAEPLALTGAQRRTLETRVHQEQDSSRRGLLREILDKDLELQALAARLSALKAALPAPEIARAHDSHYGMALHFLLRQGLPEAQARRALSQAAISERLLPGFEVYHFYSDGAYGTWVSRGTAPISPRAFTRMEPDPPVGARDEARARGRRLQQELAVLEDQKRGIDAEIATIQAERSRLVAGRDSLRDDAARQAARLNSLHYRVGVRDALEEAGIIDLPLLGKERSGRNWGDDAFPHDLDLRGASRLTLRAADLGLRRIGKVIVVPGSYLPDEHYRLDISADRQEATVELLVPSRFRNDKVVFAVVE